MNYILHQILDNIHEKFTEGEKYEDIIHSSGSIKERFFSRYSQTTIQLSVNYLMPIYKIHYAFSSTRVFVFAEIDEKPKRTLQQ